MAGQLKLRRGTTSQLANYIGSEGELTYDTALKSLVLHDGVTLGGVKIPYLSNDLVPSTMLPTATETVAGVVRLTNNLTSTDTDKALTAAQGKVLNDQAFGVGQSWVNVRSTRLVNTLYTNDTNKPISVSIANPNVYWSEFSIVVGGVVIQSSVNNYQLPISIIFNVPVGATYRVNSGAFGITNGVTAVWAELR